jgi:dihydrofolate reductase
MNKLIAFSHITLDGYFCDANGNMGWAHRADDDPEWRDYVDGNARGDGTLLFGRVTYQLMASYWPTPMAASQYPVVAERMNQMPKVVFSRTLDSVSWQNTTLLNGDLATEVRGLKQKQNMTILGSGSIVAQLAQAGLIDEFQMVVNPIAIGKGRTPFEGIEENIALKLTNSRAFRNGNVLLCYQPA